MRRVALLAFLLSACGDDDGVAPPADARGDGGGSADAGGAGDAGAACTAPSASATIVYLNRQGATYTAGPDDAVANTAALFTSQRTLAAWPMDESSWATTAACVRAGLAPFDIAVVETDPGAVDHHELVFTDQYWDTPSEILSISSIPCTPPARGVAFVFAVGATAESACDLGVSQLATATTGLDHSVDCHDFLGIYSAPCGAKSFLDESIDCGETSPRTCTCGGTQQNSWQRMIEVYGACP